MTLEAPDRIYAQYRNSPKALAWYAITRALAGQIQSAADDVTSSYDIDNVSGELLNVIARIVVTNRNFEGQVEFDTDQFGAAQFGGSQIQFKPLKGVTDSQLNDSIFRLLIKSKIARNSSDATIDGIIGSASEIVQSSEIRLIDHENMSFTVAFSTLTDLERFTLQTFDILPKPQGVRFSGYVEESVIPNFGRSQFGRDQYAYSFGA